jgi:endoglucanase
MHRLRLPSLTFLRSRRSVRALGLLCLFGAPGALSTSACDGGTSQSPGAGANAIPRLETPERPEQDELLTDFEAGALSFVFAAGFGHVASVGDQTEGLSVAGPGAADSGGALRVAPPLSQVVVRLAELGGATRAQHDLSTCAGLRWSARAPAGPGSLTVRVRSQSGTGETTVALGDDWTDVSVAWDELTDARAENPAESGTGGAGGADPQGEDGADGPGASGAGGAAPAGPFSARSVVALEFSGAGEWWLDDLTLTGCRLPQLNPTPSTPPALGTAGPEGSPVARHGQLRVEGKTLVDQAGEPVQLKGVSSMWTNWDASGFATNKDALQFMRDEWNLSVFRIAMGVEEAGAYLASPGTQRRKVERAIANAVELGVYLIVDWHAHQAEAEADAARGFFDDLAARYGHLPNILWETFNEPLQVDWSRNLKPYHTSLIETIRARDPDNVILLGTPQWSQLVDQAAADPIGARNIQYVLHFYACTHDAWLRDIADQALAGGIGLFVSEFGGTHADGGRDGIVCDGETRAWFDWLDRNGISGVAWKLDSCTADASCLLTPTAPKRGPWSAEDLHGHAPLVVEWLRE